MKLRGERLKRCIGIDIGSWEYVEISCKKDTTLSIAANLLGHGTFNLYIMGLKGVIAAPVKGRLSGFNHNAALWHKEEATSVIVKFKVVESGTHYIFFDNHHDELESKSIDIDICITH